MQHDGYIGSSPKKTGPQGGSFALRATTPMCLMLLTLVIATGGWGRASSDLVRTTEQPQLQNVSPL